MDIAHNVQIIDLALFLRKQNILIVSDLHLGYEETMQKTGIRIPSFQLKDTIKRFDAILETAKPEKIIINGDLKHSFGSILDTEWSHALRLIDHLKKKCSEMIIIKGNHDMVSEPIAKKRGIPVRDSVRIDDILIMHGDRLPLKKEAEGAKTIIIGHEHPAVSISEGARHETFKCYLKGRWKGYDLIVMPSFNTMRIGTDVLKENLISPFLHDISGFKVYVVSDKIFDFGKVKDLL